MPRACVRAHKLSSADASDRVPRPRLGDKRNTITWRVPFSGVPAWTKGHASHGARPASMPSPRRRRSMMRDTRWPRCVATPSSAAAAGTTPPRRHSTRSRAGIGSRVVRALVTRRCPYLPRASPPQFLPTPPRVRPDPAQICSKPAQIWPKAVHTLFNMDRIEHHSMM